jgi:predicted RNase H-like nuclease
MKTPAQELNEFIKKHENDVYPFHRPVIVQIKESLEHEEKELCAYIAKLMREKDSDGNYIYDDFEQAWKAMFNINQDAPWS